jgi:hypothetical protein
LLVSAFAGFLASHFLLAARLALRRPRPLGLLALLVPPAAPILGVRAGLRRTTVAWLASVALYGAALALSLR